LTAPAGERTPLAPHECRVWWATIADGGPHLESLLSAQEQERRRAYVQQDDRMRFLTGATLHELTCPAGYVATLATLGRCDRITELDAAELVRAARAAT
jgi:hypothetical protein